MKLEMTSLSVSTTVHLPPGPLPVSVVRKLLQLALKEYCWFQPFWKQGHAEEQGVDASLAQYEELKRVLISDRREQSFLLIYPSKHREKHPFVSSITWCVTLTRDMTEAWRNAHLHQVVEVMQLAGGYLAHAGLTDDMNRKKDRFIPHPSGVGTKQTFTLRDPSEGLTGLYWRNVFGPPFLRMFGDRLMSLPPGTHQELGAGLVLVQPYELPTQAMTPEGDAAEERLITVLGPECFYDHPHHRKPTRVPPL